VTRVVPDNVSSAIAQPMDMTTGESEILRVTVKVQYQDDEMAEPSTVTTLQWLVADMTH
jgi:hypothetical protein